MDPALTADAATVAAAPAPETAASTPEHDRASTWGFASFEHAVEATFKQLVENGERHTRDQVAEFLKMLHALGQALHGKQAGEVS